MTHKDLRSLRKEYQMDGLHESNASSDPLKLFGQWLDQAIAAGLSEPNAMTLATVDADGKPTARIVLLKEILHGDFLFYTNYESDKARDIEANPHASLVFLWLEQQRQVRVNGLVEKVSARTSDAYFAVRPRASQAGAIVSPQSRVIPNRESLEDAYTDFLEKAKGLELQRPDHWGGYALTPHKIEFWQGRESRLHDRLLYTREGKLWTRIRLAP